MLVIDLDHEFFKSLREAADESNWIPEDYYVNDWVSDCCEFLRTGRGIYSGREYYQAILDNKPPEF